MRCAGRTGGQQRGGPSFANKLHTGPHWLVLSTAQDNVQALRGDAAAALKQLEDAEAGAAAAVATLRELDRVKQRMEAACTTLKVSPRAAVLC